MSDKKSLPTRQDATKINMSNQLPHLRFYARLSTILSLLPTTGYLVLFTAASLPPACNNFLSPHLDGLPVVCSNSNSLTALLISA